MLIRKFNEEGLLAMNKYLDKFDQGEIYDRDSILNNDRYTILLSETIDLDQEKKFLTRLDACEYLDGKLRFVALDNKGRDMGLWSWLSLLYFQQLLSKKRDGTVSTGERARWIFYAGDYQRYYRHLLGGAYSIYIAYKNNLDAVSVVLCPKVNVLGETVAQFPANQEIIQNTEIMKAATKLYYDLEKKTLKRGAQDKSGGTPRRFTAVLKQLQLTRDLFSLSCDDILALLPHEFDKFKKA